MSRRFVTASLKWDVPPASVFIHLQIIEETHSYDCCDMWMDAGRRHACAMDEGETQEIRRVFGFMTELINNEWEIKNRWPNAASGDTIRDDPRIVCLWFGATIISTTVGWFSTRQSLQWERRGRCHLTNLAWFGRDHFALIQGSGLQLEF